MPPKYPLYSGFTVIDALGKAGEPKDSAQFQAGEPPVNFFTQPPKGSAAVFSTVFGTRPFRLVPNPTYERQGHYWWAAEIQRVCDELRRNLPDACRNIETPQDYWDLYKYFDAFDIYYRGAQNLWNVINTFVFENEYAQEVVDKEQKLQTEHHTPLFKSLAAESLKKPGIQAKLLTWDGEKQPDILKVLTTYELQIFFAGYEDYPEHFLGAIRDIFRNHYESLRKGLPLTHCLDSVEGQDISIPERLAALRRHLEEALDDPFMDKFEIPNRIVNGIVIADGTSETAARKAGYKRIISSTNNSTSQAFVRDDSTNGPPPATELPREDANPCYKEGATNRTVSGLSTAGRCSSAPSLGSESAVILSDPFTDETRVHPRDGHEVDKKHMGCEKLANPKTPSADTQNASNALQIAMNAPDSGLQQIPSIVNQTLPLVWHHTNPRRASYHQSSSTFVPGPLPSSQLPGTRDRGMSYSAFANQIPTYALSQQHAQGLPPTIQQGYYPGPVHMQPNGGGYTNNATPLYIQAGQRQQYNAPPALTGGSGGFREHKRNYSNKIPSNGKWQHVGSDDIHGPKAVFRKDGHNHGVGQWQGRESNESDRRTSTASTSGGFQRFNHTRPQQYNEHADPRQTQRGITATGSSSQAPASLGHLTSEYSDKDRTVFISRLRDGANQSDSTIECLKQHFSKFGRIDDVIPVVRNSTAFFIKFSNSQAAVAAVQTEPRVRVNGLGNSPVWVQFRTGSQFFAPFPPKNLLYSTNNQGRLTHNPPQEQRVALPQPLNTRPNNLHAHSQSFQYQRPLPEGPVAMFGAMASTGHPSGINLNGAAEHAIGVLDRAATQSGFGKETGRSYTGLGGPNVTLQPLQGLAPIDAKGTPGTASHQSLHGAQFDGMLPQESTQDLVKNIADLTHDIITSRQANLRGSPNNTVQPDCNPPQGAITPRDAQANPAGLSDNRDSMKLDEIASIDYGTVRIRPGKAQYMPIPPDWRVEPQPSRAASQIGQVTTANTGQMFQPVLSTTKGGQQVQTPAGDIAARSQHKDSEDVHLNEHLDISSHAKRKASEKNGDDDIPGQSSAKKVAKVTQPDNPSQDTRSSQPGGHQHKESVASQTRNSKKKKKNHKNKTPRLSAPENASTNAPYQTQTFKPAITTSNLPQYPQQLTREVGPGAAVLHVAEPFYVQTPAAHGNPRSNENEPFPPYRDVFSAPQFPLRTHKSYATGLAPNRSISSNVSMIIQDSSRKLHTLNPGAQNFVPPPTESNTRNSTSMPAPQSQTTPTIAQPVFGNTADDNKDDTSLKATGKENNRGRMNTGTRQGGGKGKYKNGKAWRNNRNSINIPPTTDRELQVQTEASKRTGSQDATKVQAPDDQKTEAPEKKLEATTTTKAKPKNDKKTEVKDLKRPESRMDPGSTKAALTTTPTPTPAATTSSKPKQGKMKNRPAPKKGVGTQPTTKANVRAENTTSKGPDNSKPAQTQTSSGLRSQVPHSNPNPAKPVINADEFPALPSGTHKPVPALAPIPLFAPHVASVPNPWQKAGRSTPALTSSPKPSSPKDGESESREKEPHFPGDERKGG
ncbi:hypothetical protein E0Z10_g8599 [Xylaria hypoxylon]|uniref:RRM domain-containing protein n=1 Tax=Xylaria hypoxylon TaxID=37992 RepID=A0A4Z0YUM3_9PEZI|nr:hypothetical protein E0Z10_g8599 [Xylaria hypoxylon]